MMASVSSVMSRSAQRFRLVNSKVEGKEGAGRVGKASVPAWISWVWMRIGSTFHCIITYTVG